MKRRLNLLGKAVALVLSCVLVLSFLPAFASAEGATCTVTFDSRGGSAVASQTVPAGSKLTPPASPTRSGYIFVGWYKDAACTVPWVFSSDVATGNTKLYAGWIATVPTVPASVKAVSAAYSSIKVSWAAVTYASGYEVYRVSPSTGSYTLVGSTTSLSLTKSGFTTGSTYYFKVRAYITVGSYKVYGEYSAVVSAKPVPSAPTGVKAVRASATSVKVSWGAVAGVTKYEVWRSAASSGTYTRIATTTARYYTNTRLTTGKTYYYKVRAYRLVGSTKVYSAFSSVVHAKP